MKTQTDAITVEIDPHATLPDRYLGSDEDGPRYGPVSLYDAIVDATATKIARSCEDDMKTAVANQVSEAALQMIADKLPAIIDEILTGEIKVTDRWGATVSCGTLRDEIVKYAQGQLTTSSSNSYGRQTELDKAIKEHVGYSLQKDLAEAVAGAKKKLLKALTDQTSETLSKAIYDGVNKR